MKKVTIQLGVAIVLLLVVIGVYTMWYARVEAQVAKIAAIQQEIADQTSTIAKATQAQGELKSLSSDSDTINEYFLSTNNVVSFLQNLESTGTYLNSNVVVQSVSATPTSATSTTYGQLTLSLQITGSFNSVMKTIGAIEYSPYDISITSLNLNTTPAGGANSVWTAAISCTVGTVSDLQASDTEVQTTSFTTISTTSPVNTSNPPNLTNPSSTTPEVLPPPEARATSSTTNAMPSSGSRSPSPVS